MGLRQAIQTYKTQYNQEDLPEFEAMRRRQQQQLAEQAQAQRESLDRGFSRLGGGPAGAKIKMQQQLEQDIGRQGSAAEEQLAGQELGVRRQLAEQEKARQYGTSEREAAQKFSAGENALQRAFATSERLGGQEFAGGQNAAQREFAKGERLGTQDFQKQLYDLDQAFKNKAFEFDKSSKLQELDLANRSFELEKQVAQFNTEIAKMEAGKPTDLMGGLFGPAFSTSGGALGGLFGAAGNIVGNVTSPITNVFCFLENTLIDIDENTKIRVQDLKLGDSILEGGHIYFIGSTYADPSEIYYYNGVLVTADHAVLENGKWIRVKNSEQSKNVKFLEPQKVYFLSNENHIIISNGIVFADFDEIDNNELLTDEEILIKLNENLNKGDL